MKFIMVVIAVFVSSINLQYLYSGQTIRFQGFDKQRNKIIIPDSIEITNQSQNKKIMIYCDSIDLDAFFPTDMDDDRLSEIYDDQSAFYIENNLFTRLIVYKQSDIQMRLFDLMGNMVQCVSLALVPGVYKVIIKCESLFPGMYLLNFNLASSQKNIMFIKTGKTVGERIDVDYVLINSVPPLSNEKLSRLFLDTGFSYTFKFFSNYYLPSFVENYNSDSLDKVKNKISFNLISTKKYIIDSAKIDISNVLCNYLLREVTINKDGTRGDNTVETKKDFNFSIKVKQLPNLKDDTYYRNELLPCPGDIDDIYYFSLCYRLNFEGKTAEVYFNKNTNIIDSIFIRYVCKIREANGMASSEEKITYGIYLYNVPFSTNIDNSLIIELKNEEILSGLDLYYYRTKTAWEYGTPTRERFNYDSLKDIESVSDKSLVKFILYQ